MNLLFLFAYGWIVVVRGIHFINFTFLLVSVCTWASKHNLLSIASSEKPAILGSDSLEKKGLKSVRWILTCFSPLPWKEAEADSDTDISPPTQKHHPQCLCFTLKLMESRARRVQFGTWLLPSDFLPYVCVAVLVTRCLSLGQVFKVRFPLFCVNGAK